MGAKNMLFQSLTRSQSSGDTSIREAYARVTGVSISDEKPILWRRGLQEIQDDGLYLVSISDEKPILWRLRRVGSPELNYKSFNL